MRTIPVSTDVYAAIWGARLSGEDNEDAILRRLLGIAAPEPSLPSLPDGLIGFVDNRFGVKFRPGFEITRIYKGREYHAQAVGGMWIAQDGKGYMSLNQLSASIGASENAWDSWYFVDDAGQRKPIAILRDPGKVRQRRAQLSTQAAAELLEELGL